VKAETASSVESNAPVHVSDLPIHPPIPPLLSVANMPTGQSDSANSANLPPPAVVEVIAAQPEVEERPDDPEEEEEVYEEEDKVVVVVTTPMSNEMPSKPNPDGDQSLSPLKPTQPGLISIHSKWANQNHVRLFHFIHALIKTILFLFAPDNIDVSESGNKHNPIAFDWQVANLHVQLDESQLRLALLVSGCSLLFLLLLIQCCCGCRLCCCANRSDDEKSKMSVHDLSNSSTLQDKQKLSLSAGHVHPVGGYAGQPFSAYHEYQADSTHSYEKLRVPHPQESPRKGSRSSRSTSGWPKECKYTSVDPLYQSSARSSKEGKPAYAGSVNGSGASLCYGPRPYLNYGYGGSTTGSMRFADQTNGTAGSLSSLQPDFYFMPHQRRYSGEVVRVFVDYDNQM
jgi:hypothetical protein